ncbi:hypothetical protein V1639_15245 [Pseudarthrobacter sp. J75]|uniref:CG0192-related protein n=1 Tax=unclassified Pseudarthrobacter TaxID=2647000 RepID=UPI002E81EB8A|nr:MULTISPECIES: hypothetical protein [unclassified Pseudarthrobacter]MEE2524097.1 hypothetical protein [Pseudarthrobacter sp. J47]MEE2530376.1 hypothetical protein [Pseudarthrobacter sp. J75]MEE2568852.1 hypothetical protein [Pseudarthrobacter sp. J64]
MAILHKATLTPTKLQLIEQFLPAQAWFNPEGAPGEVELLGAYRFDDPDGEVGLETHLVAHAGSIYQVPLTYRGAELPDAQQWLVGTTDHSVLGKRWVYDATGDPVYVAALATAILRAQEQAEQFVQTEGKLEPRPSTVQVKGSGMPDGGIPALGPSFTAAAPTTDNGVTVIDAGTLQLHVFRVLDLSAAPANPGLNGTWQGQDQPVRLATLVEIPDA